MRAQKAFPSSKLKAAVVAGGGWLWGQSILTLIQIAPDEWSAAALAATGALGVIPLLFGLQRLLSPHPYLTVEAEGLTFAPGRRAPVSIPWEAVAGYALGQGGKARFRLNLADPTSLARELPFPHGQIMAWNARRGRAHLTVGPLVLETSLGRLHAAFREHRPDLDRTA
ncbi:MAG: hypothetical protein AAF713_20050 [Pseudomonadota bacterium]